ncbi:ABC transporter permease [Erythrobacter sp. T5W1-R]|uniref:ABC transporter permease n=1 Tax=Erythrobacter sp. T5W1-R TaxID=3101752 RepID=UPI002AFE3D1B|nr:ABC transporter permease [Erythrobacter sp. T5W1-R]MEA1619331.1 ABC transporter permease [Erythrobacter sp. T5W1-R]
MSVFARISHGFARELRFLARNPWDLALLTWLPLALCAIIAWQLSAGVIRDLPVALVDQERGALARDLAIRIEGAPGLRLAYHAQDMAEAERMARAGAVEAIVLIPREVTARALEGRGQITLFVNAAHSAASSTIQRELAGIIGAANGRVAIEQMAAVLPPGTVRAAPLAASSAIAFNAPASQEQQLVSLLHPALLHLLFMLAVVSAFGRELRDASVAEWRPDLAAMAGKAAPYVLAFMVWGALATAYLAGLRGWTLAGGPALLMTGYLAMFVAYTGVALLLVGATRCMSQSLSLTGLYAGASFAFAGAIFPVDQASSFAKVWAEILPFTHFARLIALDWVSGAEASVAAAPLLPLAIITLVTGVPGAWLFLRASRSPQDWGRR